MADPISLTLAILPIAASLSKVVKDLHDLRKTVSHAKAEVNTFHQEATMLNQLLLLVHRSVSGVPRNILDDDIMNIGKDLKKQAKFVIRQFQKMLPLLKNLVHPNRMTRLRERVVWASRKKEVLVLQSKINSHKLSLSIFMHSVQILVISAKVAAPPPTKPPPLNDAAPDVPHFPTPPPPPETPEDREDLNTEM